MIRSVVKLKYEITEQILLVLVNNHEVRLA